MSFGENIAELVEKSPAPLVQKASGWCRVPLGSVADILNGYPFASQQFNSERGAPVIRIRDVTSGKTETKYSGEIPEGYWIEVGDYIVGMDGDFNARVWNSERALLNQRVCKISADHQFLEPTFLAYVLPGYLKLINDHTPSVTVKHLSSRTLQETPIPLPPLPEQRQIVRKLDTLSARSTTARTHLTAIEKLVERYKLSVLSGALFRDGAPVKRLGEVLTDIRYGTAAKCSYDPSGTPVLRIPNIQLGRIDRTDLKSAHFAKKEIEQLTLKAGDILVIRSNGSPDLVGRVALVTDSETDCLFAGYLIRLRLSETEALPEYVRLCFESDEVRAIIEAASKSTSGVNNINSTQLREIALPLPTVNEQREIVRRIETAFAKIDRLAAEAEQALKLLGHLDQRILAKAFAGDLVPQDPTDEPAETLLARIVEARAAAPKARRGRTTRKAP